jgi:hypothetical protein
MEGIAPNQIQLWLDNQTGKVLVHPFDTDVHHIQNHAHIAKDQMRAVKDITGSESISVATLERNLRERLRRKSPAAFLIHDLTMSEATLLC